MPLSTMLLVDDSVTIQRVIELTFANENVRVVAVGDGRRALHWMEREAPDVLLVDVDAPDVDGYALTRHVREAAHLKHVPVLLLAGVFEPIDEADARAAGADGVLAKPFEPEQLVTRVRALLEHGTSRRDTDVIQSPPRRVVTPFPTAAARSAATVAAALDAPAQPMARASGDAALPSRVSLANAFSALLAAEHAVQPAAAPAAAAPVLSDAVVEEAVRKALVRMTDSIVRRIVVETAERLIREEIEKIKAQPE
jgi:CheY-like chemotaxis protein